MHGSDKQKNFSLKYVHNDQCSRLQQRYQNEAQLLEDLRLFVKQKSVIEKAYGQSLMKLCQQFSSKISQSLLAKSHKSQGDNILLTDAWRHYLSSVEEIGKVRVQGSEFQAADVSEVCKHLRNHRTQVAKLVFDCLSDLQKDVLQSSQDVQRMQKNYKEKFLKTREGYLKVKSLTERTKSPSKIQSQLSQLQEEVSSLEARSDAARNNYLLDLASSNAHLNEYRTSHLLDLIQLVDGEIYEDWRRILRQASELERRNCQATIKCCEDIDSSCDKISKEYDIRCFLANNPCFTEALEASFLPLSSDKKSKVVITPFTKPELEKEARSSSMLIAREEKAIEKCQAELEKIQLESMGIEDRTKHYEAYFNLRRFIKTSKTRKEKAMARLKTLQDGGLDITTWMNDAKARMSGRCDDDTDSFDSGHQIVPKDSSPGDRTDHFEDSGSVKTISDDQPTVYPYWCSALYDYEAVNTDELSFKADDRLKMIGDGSGDGWLWAENESGAVGLVPQNYISTFASFLTSEEKTDPTRAEEEPLEESISAETNRVSVLRAAPPPPAKKENHKENAPKELKIQPNLTELKAEPIDEHKTEAKPVNLVKLADKDVFWVRALYNYEATCDEELSFSEGQLIKVTVTSRDVDDGWWEGEVKGRRGIFPSMIVEEVFVVTPGKEYQHSPDSNNKSLTETTWKSSFNLSSGAQIKSDDRKIRYTVTPTDCNENNNNNNSSFDDEDDVPATSRAQFTHADTSRFKIKSNFPTSKIQFSKEGTISNLGANWKHPADQVNSVKPGLIRMNEDSFIVGTATLGRRVGKDVNDRLPESHSVRSFWNISPNNGKGDAMPKMEEYSAPASVRSARSSRQRPWKRPTNSDEDVGIAPPPINYQQPQKHNYDFSTLPRSHKKEQAIGRNPISGIESGPCRSEISDSGIEIHANYLGIWNRDEYSNNHQQQDYDILRAANNRKYANIPSYQWPNGRVVNSPPSNVYSASRERDASLYADSRRASKAFGLAGESRESYI